MIEPAKRDEVEAPSSAVVMATCELCNRSVPRPSMYRVNSRVSCAECVAKVRVELAAQVPTGSNILVAGVCGLVGALAGAAVWCGVAIATDLEVGYIAVLVGFLAGLGVKLGAGRQRGPVLQYLAAGLAIVGLLAAKYMLFAYVLVKLGHEQGVDLSYFDPRFWSVFPRALGDMVGVFDVLFLVLALGAAFRVPKTHVVSIDRL